MGEILAQLVELDTSSWEAQGSIPRVGLFECAWRSMKVLRQTGRAPQLFDHKNDMVKLQLRIAEGLILMILRHDVFVLARRRAG